MCHTVGDMPMPPGVPPPNDESYWTARLRQHHLDNYRGRSMVKMPEDLRTFQHVIEATQPEVIVELGTHAGGSALWLTDQLLTLTLQNSHHSIITVDNRRHVPLNDPSILEIFGDLTDQVVVDLVHEAADGRRTMVIDDSAHTYDITIQSLALYSDLVASGCYFVVEDGIVDEPMALPEWNAPGGVQKACKRFVEERPDFTREYLAPYGMTMHHGGWLKKQ